MMRKKQTTLSAKTNICFSEEADIAFNSLIEQVWWGLDCQVRRERVYQLVLEEAFPFQEAIAAQCIPGLIHRRVRARLIEEMKNYTHARMRHPIAV